MIRRASAHRIQIAVRLMDAFNQHPNAGQLFYYQYYYYVIKSQGFITLLSQNPTSSAHYCSVTRAELSSYTVLAATLLLHFTCTAAAGHFHHTSLPVPVVLVVPACSYWLSQSHHDATELGPIVLTIGLCIGSSLSLF